MLTDLLARALAVTILTPLVGLLLKLFLTTTETGVVADQAIVSFLLHPIGMATLVIVSAVSLSILFAETGQLMVIAFGAVEDRRVTWLDAVIYAYRRAMNLVPLAGHTVIRLLIIAVPFVAAIAGAAWLLLRTYDINYYLSHKPPEFLAAVAIAGLLALVMVLVMTSRIAGWLLSLPMVLFEEIGGRDSLRASEKATSAHRRKLGIWIIGWIVATALLAMSATFLVGSAAGFLVPRVTSNITLLLITLSGFLVLSGIANLAISFVTTAFFPLLIVRIYRSIAGPGELRPEICARGTLGGTASWRLPGKPVLAAAAFVLVIVIGLSFVTLGHIELEDTAQIIAHRGGEAVAPENTIAAFQQAISDRADWLEIDVQENGDGEVVIAHDRDFMRVAGADLDVFRATNQDLARIDIGSFFNSKYSDQRTPTLHEALELAKGKAGLFIELKYYGHDVSLEQKVVDLVEETGMSSNIVIMSLEYDGLRKTAALRPDWTYGLLNAVAIGDLTRLDVGFLALTAKASSTSMIRRTHKRGMKIYTWTIDDPVQMWVMMSRGVDGIITNKVALANQVKGLRAQVTPVGRFIIWMAGESGLLGSIDATSARDEA